MLVLLFFFSGDDVIDSGRKILEDQGAFGQFFLGWCFFFLAGEYQYRAGARSNGGFEVAQGIPDGMNIGQVDIETVADAGEHAGLGFTTFAVGVGRVRAIENGIDAAADGLDGAIHFVVDGVERIHVEQAASDARLVGGNHDLVTGLIQPGDGFQATRQWLPFGSGFDEVDRVVIDDAVAVENDKFHFWREV